MHIASQREAFLKMICPSDQSSIVWCDLTKSWKYAAEATGFMTTLEINGAWFIWQAACKFTAVYLGNDSFGTMEESPKLALVS